MILQSATRANEEINVTIKIELRRAGVGGGGGGWGGEATATDNKALLQQRETEADL